MALTYAFLPDDQYERLREHPYFAAQPLPVPGLAHIAEESGRIRAFWCAESIMHAEPAFIDESLRGSGVVARNLLFPLLSKLHTMNIPDVYITTANATHAHMLERLGFEAVGTLYRRAP